MYELRARCHDAGLPETGRKAALVARLSNANQPPRGTVNQETPPGQHQGAESDPPLATDGALERAIERILDRRLQTARQRRRSTHSGLRHRTHPASALLRARRLLRSVAKPFSPICVQLDVSFAYFSLVLRILTPGFSTTNKPITIQKSSLPNTEWVHNTRTYI